MINGVITSDPEHRGIRDRNWGQMGVLSEILGPIRYERSVAREARLLVANA